MSAFASPLKSANLTQKGCVPVEISTLVKSAAAVAPGAVVFRQPADGYTLALDGSGFWIGALLEDVQYDPVKDYAPISVVATSPHVDTGCRA